MGVVSSDMASLAAEIKDLQRQTYFLSLERTRKRKLAKSLQAELDVDIAREPLEKLLAAEIKKVVSNDRGGGDGDGGDGDGDGDDVFDWI